MKKTIVVWLVIMVLMGGMIDAVNLLTDAENGSGDDEWLLSHAQPRVLANESDIWVQTNGPYGGIINVIEIDPGNPDVLYCGGAGSGVFKSTDCGGNWILTERIFNLSLASIGGLDSAHDPEVIRDLIISPDNNQTLYGLATHGGGIKSINGGQNWSFFGEEYDFSCIAMNPTNSSIIIAGTGRGCKGVYYSDDGAENWNDITSNLVDKFGVCSDIAFGAANEFWVGFSNGENGHLYHTTNEGVSWDEMDIGQRADTDTHTIFVDPGNTNTVYVGLVDVHNEMFDSQNDNYLLKTEDGGTTWTPLHLPGTNAMINVIGRAPNDDTLYVGTGGTVYKSSDGGQSWTGLGKAGRSGDMYDIAIDPRNTDVLYLPRCSHGISKSTDGGETWMPINKGILNVGVALMAVPNTPDSNTVYVASIGGEGTFKTTDWGNSWTYLNEGGITHPWTDELVVSPHDPETIWEVADVAEVFETTDGGTTWNKIINPHGDGFRFGSIHALATAPSDPNIIYAIKDGFGIYKSTDGGSSWRFLHQTEVDYTYTLAVHPTNPDIVYSGYNPKPFQNFAMVRRTTDGGDSWQTVLNVTNSHGITSVVIDPNNPDTVYAGSTGEEGEIYVSNDSGETWSKLNDNLTFTTIMRQAQLKVHPSDKNIIYAGTWMGGTYKSVDGGSSWLKLDNAPESSTGLAIYEADPNIIYSCDRTQPVIHKSEDGGQTWREYYRFNSPSFLTSAVEIDPNDPDTIYAGAYDFPFAIMGPFVKITNGTKVADLDEGMPGMSEGLPCGESVVEIEVDPNNPDTIYVAKHGYGVFKTMNGGVSWERLDDQGTGSLPRLGYYDIDVDYSNSSTLYATGLCELLPEYILGPTGLPYNIEQDAGGVYKSTDGGYNWSRILETETANRAIEIDPQNPNVLYVASRTDGIFVSSDGGQSWHQENDGLPSLATTSVVAMDGYIYASIEACGVYAGVINDDYSITWDESRSNKPKAYVYNIQIAVDPLNSSRIYATANPGAMIGSDDGGKHWCDRNVVTPSIVVDDPFRQGYCCFDIDPNSPAKVWMGVYGKGMFRSYEYMYVSMFANGDHNEMFRKHITDVVIDPSDSNTIYVATEEGMFVTRDDGKNWSEMNDGLDTTQIQTLAMTADGVLLCGTLGYELYRYNELTNSWVQMNAFGQFGTFWPIWDDRPLYQYTTLLFHPTDPNIIYVGTFPVGMYKSTDGGQSWREINVGWTNDGIFSLVFHPNNTDIIYAGTYNGMSRSIDAGAHWEMWDNGWPAEQWVFSIDFDPRNPDVMYACSKNGENEGTGREGFHGTVMKSTDGGTNWFNITTGLNVDQEFYQIIVDKHEPDILYLATQYEGVFISHDCGTSWASWSDGLTNLVAGTNGNNVACPMVQSADGRYLYFGSAGSGVFRRKNASNQLPWANFTYSPSYPTTSDTISFTDTSIDSDGAIVSWYWEFGDGSTSTEQNPEHQYADDGIYTVTLTVTDNATATDSISVEIYVTKTIGPAGGNITVEKLTLVIPPNALSENVSFNITAVSVTPPEGYEIVGNVYNIECAITTFTNPITITLSYEGIALPENVSDDDLAIYKRADNTWNKLGGTIDKIKQTISVEITTLSEFAIFYKIPIEEEEEEDNTIIWYMLGIGMILAILLLLAIYYFTKKKEAAKKKSKGKKKEKPKKPKK